MSQLAGSRLSEPFDATPEQVGSVPLRRDPKAALGKSYFMEKLLQIPGRSHL